MNYYHDLLSSYSQLKKRSLKLIKEQETAAAPVAPGSKAMIAAAIQKNGVDVRYSHPNNPKKHITLNVRTTSGQKGGVGISKVQANIGGSWRDVADGNGMQSQSYLVTGFGELERWLQQQGPGEGPPAETAKKADGEGQTDQEKSEEELNTATGEQVLSAEEMTANIQAENEAALHDILSDFGVVSEDENARPSLLDELDPFGEDQTNARNGYKNFLKRLFDGWVENTDIPIGVKLSGARTIRDFVSLAVKIKNREAQTTSPEESFALRKLMGEIKRTNNGGIIVGSTVAAGDFDALEFGLTVEGEEAKGVGSLLEILNNEKDKYNAEIAKGDKWDMIPDPDTVEIAKSAVPGRTPNLRGTADEILMTVAGEIDAIVGSTGEERAWRLEKVKSMMQEAETIFPEFAQTFSRGLEAIDGIGVATLLSEHDKELTSALINRLQVDYPTQFNEESASTFVGELAEDQAGLRAFAATLLLRHNTIKRLFGKGHSPVLAVGKGKAWSTGEDNYRRKLDMAYLFDGSKETSTGLKKHLKQYVGAGENVGKFVETKSIQKFIDDGILELEDLPPSMQDQLDTELTLASVSLKTLANDGKSINLGSNSGNSTVTKHKDNPKGYESAGRKAVHKSIVSTGIASKEDIVSLNQMYDVVRHGDRPAKGDKSTQAFLFQEITRKARNKDTKGVADAAVLDLVMLGGIAREPQLNVVNTFDDGAFTAESDEAFKKKLVSNMKSGKWEIHYGGKSSLGGRQTPSNKNKQAFIVERKEDGTMMPIVRINSSNGEGRTNIWKTNEYHQSLKKRNPASSPSTKPENNSEMLVHFLNAQAKVIQELLANK